MKTLSHIKNQTIYVSEHVFQKKKHTHAQALQKYCKYVRQKVQSGYILMSELFVYLDIFQNFCSEHIYYTFKGKIYHRK